MTEYEKIVVGAAITYGCGIASGVLLEQWRERRTMNRTILQDYLVAIQQDQADQDDYRRFAVLQRVGAWRLSQRELETLADEICGRGRRHPYAAWKHAFHEMNDFPKDFLLWAKDNGVDLSEPYVAMQKIAEEYDTRQIPAPPPGPGIFIV